MRPMTVRLSLTLGLFLFVSTSAPFAADITPSQRVKKFVTIRPGPFATGDLWNLLKGERAPLLESVPHRYKIQRPNGQPGFVPKAWTEITTEDPNVSPPTTTSANFKIHFLDVGTGDSDMSEQEILIDGGNYANDLHDYLKQEDIVQGAMELVIITHGDQDHWKRMVRLFNFDGQGTTPRTLREFGTQVTTETVS